MLSFSQQKEIIARVIEREGGYVNDPDDPGGETKYGISKRSYPTLDIKNLTVEQASDIYMRDFLRRFMLERLDRVDTAEWVMDWLVHSGTLALRIIQKQLKVTVDGIMGPQTLKALNNMRDPEDILRWRAEFLIKLNRPKYTWGWIKRLFKLGL